jgi:hypothetical protein
MAMMYLYLCYDYSMKTNQTRANQDQAARPSQTRKTVQSKSEKHSLKTHIAMHSAGYRMTRDPTTQRFMLEHRIVAADVLQRSLLPGEVVHHKNGIRFDNRPSNLVVCSNQSVHMIIEHFERRKDRGAVPLFTDAEMLRCKTQFSRAELQSHSLQPFQSLQLMVVPK